jgi:hypothetical protein
LLPLADEGYRLAHAPVSHDATRHGNCGCKSGTRQPCPGCLEHGD